MNCSKTIAAGALLCAVMLVGGCTTTKETTATKTRARAAVAEGYTPWSERPPSAASYWARRDLEDRIESEIERRSSTR